MVRVTVTDCSTEVNTLRATIGRSWFGVAPVGGRQGTHDSAFVHKVRSPAAKEEQPHVPVCAGDCSAEKQLCRK